MVFMMCGLGIQNQKYPMPEYPIPHIPCQNTPYPTLSIATHNRLPYFSKKDKENSNKIAAASVLIYYWNKMHKYCNNLELGKYLFFVVLQRKCE